MTIVQYSTTKDKKFDKKDVSVTNNKEITLEVTNEVNREIEGFGSCFNELGYSAISLLSKENQEKLYDELFDPDGECRFNLCRLPIGASDYAESWYSHNEVENDFDMEQFSIERDKEKLIPYIKEALKRNPDLVLSASPWSPPTWMKTRKTFNHGTLVWTDEILHAYALYFVKFVQAYEEEGITIDQIHVQNEVIADQKFPSCRWTGIELREFIKNYLGPAFEKHQLKTEIWLGTINAPEALTESDENRTEDYDVYAGTVLRDPKARKYISGVGYQWAGKNAVQRTVEAFPEKRILQTENECGNGDNTWLHAEYVYGLFRHYFVNGTNGYMYWNAVLEPRGISTWGWEQNSMITVDPSTKEVIYNPEYYVVKHFSKFVKKGARQLTTTGMDSAISTAFKNPDGSVIVTLCNKREEAIEVVAQIEGERIELHLPPHSFHTIVSE